MKTIHNRTINEGYVIIKGQIYKLSDMEDLGSET